MTNATVKPSAEVNVHTGHIKIANMTPELDAAMQRWYEQANAVLRTLRAPCFLLNAIQEDDTPPEDQRIDTALLTTEQRITMLEKLEDELDHARSHWLFPAPSVSDCDKSTA